MDDLLKRAAGLARAHLDAVASRAPVGTDGPERFARHLEAAYGFQAPRPADVVLDDLARMLARGTAHGGHPRYFGPFHPGVDPVAVAASTLLAAANPQPAVVDHAAAAVALERHTLAAFGRCLGLADGGSARFTGGAQESLLDALVCALHARFPEVRTAGVRALPGAPRVYASAEAHHALEKACRVSGLGDGAVVRVAADAHGQLDLEALEAAVLADRRAGMVPLALIATAGTTTTGAIDPLVGCAEQAASLSLHLHVDAASGGLLALSPTWARSLDGLSRADSIAWDAHKLLPIPLAAGMLFRRTDEGASRAFGVESPYVPEGDEPYGRGLPWSRRAHGVPVFAWLATRGLPGVAEHVDTLVARGVRLERALADRGLRRVGGSPLPVVTVVPYATRGYSPREAAARVRAARAAGCFVSTVGIAEGRAAIRVVVTDPSTLDVDVDAVADALATSG